VLDVPFAAHRFIPRLAVLDIEQEPRAPARRLRTGARIVCGETLVDVVGPADIGAAVAVFTPAAENIDEGFSALGLGGFCAAVFRRRFLRLP